MNESGVPDDEKSWISCGSPTNYDWVGCRNCVKCNKPKHNATCNGAKLLSAMSIRPYCGTRGVYGEYPNHD